MLHSVPVVRSYTYRGRSEAHKAKARAYSRAGTWARRIDILLKSAATHGVALRSEDIERWRSMLGRWPRVDDMVFGQEGEEGLLARQVAEDLAATADEE